MVTAHILLSDSKNLRSHHQSHIDGRAAPLPVRADSHDGTLSQRDGPEVVMWAFGTLGKHKCIHMHGSSRVFHCVSRAFGGVARECRAQQHAHIHVHAMQFLCTHWLVTTFTLAVLISLTVQKGYRLQCLAQPSLNMSFNFVLTWKREQWRTLSFAAIFFPQ